VDWNATVIINLHKDDTSVKAPVIPPLDFQHFFSFSELTAFAENLAASRPGLVSLETIGNSREGRALHMLTITDKSTGAAEDKPAYLIHGNIHAAELSGTHAALATARQLVVDHPSSGLLKRVAFHIIPRINPDGAEFVVATSGTVRSRIDRSRREPNTLYQEDINGDSLVLTMRQEHPDGQFVADPKDKRLLVLRKKDSKPPFYRKLPEGMIYDWDGTDNISIEGRAFDWNRNWSHDWRPEPEENGPGDFPFSEVELHALAKFIHSRPNIFGMLGYHTGPAAVLRPPSSGQDTDLDASDVHVMQELAEAGGKYTGFPVLPLIKFHYPYERDHNLRGHFQNFGYHHLGLFVFEFELGLLLNSAGVSTEEIMGVMEDKDNDVMNRRMMKWWDRQQKRDPVFSAWKPFDHPQLGRVEIGGLLIRHTAGPTLDDLKKIAKSTYQFTVHHASLHPLVQIEELSTDRVGADVFRVRARIANRGHLPTYVSNKGRTLRRLREVRVELCLAKGIRLLSHQGHTCIGHLKGLTGSRIIEWFLKAPKGAVSLGEIAALGGTGGNVRVKIPTAE